MAFGWTGRAWPRHGARVLMWLALLLGGTGWTSAGAVAVENVRVADGQVVIRFDGAVVQAAAFLLDGPRRIAVDVTGAGPAAALGTRVELSGPVTAVRQAARPGGARIVFDLASPAVVAGGEWGRDGRELVLQLRETGEREFARAAGGSPIAFLFGGGGEPHGPRYKVAQAVPPATRAPGLPRVRGEDGRPLVVIDAGHGGVDPGAPGPDGLREKDVTLRIARAIRDQLLASGRVRVALTRDDDRYLVLRDRFGIARRLGADLFISIHCDSAGTEDATGATVYTLSEVASDKEAARLAARENKADVIAGVNLGEAGADVSSILIDLAQRETMNASAGFARLLGREARPLIPTKPNFHRMASLMVLKAPDMPSVLFETGYLSNPADAAFLASADGRERVAQSIRRAVEVHFARRVAAR